MNKILIRALFFISIQLILIDLTKSFSVKNSSVISNNINKFDSVNDTNTEFLERKKAPPSTIQIEGKCSFVRLLSQIQKL